MAPGKPSTFRRRIRQVPPRPPQPRVDWDSLPDGRESLFRSSVRSDVSSETLRLFEYKLIHLHSTKKAPHFHAIVCKTDESGEVSRPARHTTLRYAHSEALRGRPSCPAPPRLGVAPRLPTSRRPAISRCTDLVTRVLLTLSLELLSFLTRATRHRPHARPTTPP